ncbi:MAG: hypothetical protein ACP5SH_27995 [Syntrophobacteraceae bacterium]
MAWKVELSTRAQKNLEGLDPQIARHVVTVALIRGAFDTTPVEGELFKVVNDMKKCFKVGKVSGGGVVPASWAVPGEGYHSNAGIAGEPWESSFFQE